MNAALQVEQASGLEAGRAIAEVIGEYAANFRYEDIPEAVREQARYILLDAIGIAFASTNFEFAQRAYSALGGLDGETGGTVIGMLGKLPMRDAVMMNSMLVHGLDFDDTYLAGAIHPTSSCFPSAMGVAEYIGASGRDMLAAYVLGMEVVTRLAGVAQGSLNQCGLHPSSMLGGFAGAVVAGWLTRLNAHQMTMAQGIALGMAGGTLESLQDGSWTKRMQPGWAAASGITAARLARQGFIGSKAAYEGRFGLYPAHMGERAAEFDYGAATRELGISWTLLQVALKPYPACHAAQAVIQAAITLSRETGVKAEDIDAIVAIVPPQYVKLVCEPIERKRRPDSMYGAQFSIPYTAACSLINGRFGLAEIQDAKLRDASTLALAQKVSYQVDTQYTTAQLKTNFPAELVVKTTDGRTLSHKVSHLMGTPDRPMTHDEIIAKFMDNARSVMSDARAAHLRDQVLAIETFATARDFAALLRA